MAAKVPTRKSPGAILSIAGHLMRDVVSKRGIRSSGEVALVLLSNNGLNGPLRACS